MTPVSAQHLLKSDDYILIQQVVFPEIFSVRLPRKQKIHFAKNVDVSAFGGGLHWDKNWDLLIFCVKNQSKRETHPRIANVRALPWEVGETQVQVSTLIKSRDLNLRGLTSQMSALAPGLLAILWWMGVSPSLSVLSWTWETFATKVWSKSISFSEKF